MFRNGSPLQTKNDIILSHTESTVFVRHSSEYETSDNNRKASQTLTANRTQYSSFHVNLSASGIYFGSPFGCYPTFQTLTSVE